MSRPLKHGRRVAALALIALASNALGQTQNTTKFEYDAIGNTRKVVDGLLKETIYTYDKLNRRRTAVDADAKSVVYGYDGQDQLTSVIDQRQLQTEYTVDGLGNVTVVVSPDTGTSTSTYDESGNLRTSRDAKNQVTTYSYDVLNRVKTIQHADASVVTYTYDEGVNAIGRLSRITDKNGVIAYTYDDLGRTVKEERWIGDKIFATEYRYDSEGRLKGMTYPGGREINYQFDALGRTRHIATKYADVSAVLVANVLYEPFGPVNTVTFGNGQSQVRSFDLDGRLATYTLGAKTMAVGYDAASRIKSIGDAAAPATGTVYGYDKVDRLASAITPTSGQGYHYDGVGNRTQTILNGSVTLLDYAPSSNRLAQVGGQPIATDPNGSIVDKGNATFAYDARGRMLSATTAAGEVKYLVNALGQRVRKITPTETVYFHYDLFGKLIAESEVKGGVTRLQEHVYLGDMPVAVIK